MNAKAEVLETFKVEYKQGNNVKRRAVVFYLDKGTGFLGISSVFFVFLPYIFTINYKDSHFFLPCKLSILLVFTV